MIAQLPFRFPFPISVYGQTFNTANVASNGSFGPDRQSELPSPMAVWSLPNTLWDMAILPYQDDLRTDAQSRLLELSRRNVWHFHVNNRHRT